MKGLGGKFYAMLGSRAAVSLTLGVVYAGALKSFLAGDWLDLALMLATSVFVLFCLWFETKSKACQLSDGDNAQVLGFGPVLFIHYLDKSKSEAVVAWRDVDGTRGIGSVRASLLTKVSK